MDNCEKSEIDPVIAFDTLYTNNRLQILKIILPYIDEKMQLFLAIYIKLSELIIAFHFAKTVSCDSYKHGKEADLSKIIKYISPYLSDAENDLMNQFSSMQENMEQYKQMAQMMQMMNDFEDSKESVLQSFLSDEQLEMFKMFREDLS